MKSVVVNYDTPSNETGVLVSYTKVSVPCVMKIDQFLIFIKFVHATS